MNGQRQSCAHILERGQPRVTRVRAASSAAQTTWPLPALTRRGSKSAVRLSRGEAKLQLARAWLRTRSEPASGKPGRDLAELDQNCQNLFRLQANAALLHSIVARERLVRRLTLAVQPVEHATQQSPQSGTVGSCIQTSTLPSSCLRITACSVPGKFVPQCWQICQTKPLCQLIDCAHCRLPSGTFLPTVTTYSTW